MDTTIGRNRRTTRTSGSAAGFLWTLALLLPTAAGAQVTARDYARAESLLGWNTERLVTGAEVDPEWLEDDRFWYRNRTGEGHEFVLVDPERATRDPAFDHGRLAAALSLATGDAYQGHALPIGDMEVGEGAVLLSLDEAGWWRCDLESYRCQEADDIDEGPGPGEMASPDGRWIAFVRDHDLWVRSTDGGEEVRLTTDGEADFGYGVFTQRWDRITRLRNDRRMPPVVAWSPDSRRILTYRLDERNVERMHVLETRQGRPVHHSYRYAIPGDSVIPRYQLHVFDLETREGVAFRSGFQDMMEVPMRTGSWDEVRWSADGETVFFTRGHRGYQRYDLLAADARTGEVRTVLEERGSTFLELASPQARTGPNWRLTDGDREVIWYSERNGWGHLYRFDASTGELLGRVTSGSWNVVDLWHPDADDPWIYFTATGREADRDPYLRHLYRVQRDGSGLELLTPEPADHLVTPSPSGRYFVDTYSRRDTVPVTVVRDREGEVVQTLEAGDVSSLLAAGWRWPVPFRAKGRDGATDVHGYLYFPPDMREDERYPVVDYTYPGPQAGPIGFRSFDTSPGGDPHALSELGFIVFTVDAMGTPLRSKAFHDAYYGNMGDHGLPDHIAALRELAERYPQMDLERVGIFGHSGGGFASTAAILRYPGFFKVAVASAGNHDNRSHGFQWSEKYQGLLTENPDGTDSFDSQANQNLAADLEGKLLLMYGTLDDRVNPNHTLLVIDALVRHNKDFDLVVLPNRNHGFSSEPYVIRKRWDYFVRHLLGQEPPPQYEIRRPER